ncbi:hypothetical protein GCK72_009150 [Caenorhabditis remanei]|uniref:Sdz-33 F-box domain-containing protein n=1 Tax=Caenorhabditis remanei TaxID=31234 RepID=A0A6A5GZI0_CAERE|nr:hypothetical protein GCK72_009150 [Caenorhabditis remanei]KAF1760898.1 hypothetical protein GCK72_009150 [Caenorhabditis remanei]
MVSMRSKKIVCSLNLLPECEEISLYKYASCHLLFQLYPFRIRVTFKKFEKDAERELVGIERPEIVEFHVSQIVGNRYESEQYQWENRTFEVRDFIDHFMEILHHDWIDELTVVKEDAYPPESIQQLINGLELRQFKIYEQNSEDDMMTYLNAIKPTRSLHLERSPLFVWNHTKMSQFFIQNLNLIDIGKAYSLTLDDLLLMNTSEIQIVTTRMTGKDFNRFLKHWIAGSNPRLRYLWIGCELTDDFDEEQYERDLLQGIDHRKMADGEERTYGRHMGLYEESTETISGGSYIRRKDGTEAIVFSEEIFFHLILQ